MRTSSKWLSNHIMNIQPKLDLESSEIIGNYEWRNILNGSVSRKNEYRFFGTSPSLYYFIFRGGNGYGKHTMEDALISTVYSSNKYRVFDIPEKDIIGNTVEETCRNIQEIFDELLIYYDLFDDALVLDPIKNTKRINYYCCIKFGSLDKILKKRKTAEYFAEGLQKIKAKGRGTSIITACVDNSINIHKSIQKLSFYINLGLPNDSERKEMIDIFLKENPYICMENDNIADAICRVSNGLSFGELKSSLAMLKMFYKGMYLSEHKISDFGGLKILENDVFISQYVLEHIFDIGEKTVEHQNQEKDFYKNILRYGIWNGQGNPSSNYVNNNVSLNYLQNLEDHPADTGNDEQVNSDILDDDEYLSEED